MKNLDLALVKHTGTNYGLVNIGDYIQICAAEQFMPRINLEIERDGLNKKLKKLARKSALSLKAKDKAITIVEDFDFKTPKTKKFIEVLKALKIDGQKSLLVFGINNNVYLSSRNFKGSDVVTSSEVSTYKILNAKQLVLSESSLNSINENLSK